jgi:hypothetical protein
MTSTQRNVLSRSFASAFGGTVITRDDDRYDAARAVWNGTVDARPALIAQCHTGDEPVHDAYGDATYQRLARLKREYDPANLLRRNQNVRPAR